MVTRWAVQFLLSRKNSRGDNDSCARKWCWFEDFRHFALIWCKNTVDLLMRLMAFHGFSEASFRRYIRGASRWKLWIGQLSPNYTCLSKIWQCWSFASLFSSKKQLNRADLRWILRQKEQGEPNIFGWKKMWSKDGVCVCKCVCVSVCVTLGMCLSLPVCLVQECTSLSNLGYQEMPRMRRLRSQWQPRVVATPSLGGK